MRALPRPVIFVLVVLLAAIAVDYHAMAWRRQLSPIQNVDLHRFPLSFGPWTGKDWESEITQATRSYYGTDNFIDRVYAAEGRNPVELVLLPVGAGLHSPKICSRYGGIVISDERSARAGDEKSMDRFIAQSVEAKQERYACSYYWQKVDGVVHEPRSSILPATHYADSLLVRLCTPVEGDGNEGFAELASFRSQVDGAIKGLIGASADEDAAAAR